MTDDLAYTPATELLAAYRAKTLSAVEAAAAALARIDAHDGTLNAYALVDHEGALAAARKSEARWAKGAPRGLVDGVPTSIKDVLLTRGWPTLRGSKTVDPGQPWTEDAPAVARMREHGAVFLGKTTTPEFGGKGVTGSPLTGITRNPWNPERTPGGSSGGAAPPRWPPAWGRSPSAPTRAARSAFRRASPASSASSPVSAGCRPGRRARSRPSPMSGPWRAVSPTRR